MLVLQENYAVWSLTTLGGLPSAIVCLSMMISLIVGSDGTSNMRSRRVPSVIIRRARAPVPVAFAFCAIASRASSVKVSLTFSSEKSCSYCLTMAFFGLLRMSTRSWVVSSLQLAMLLNRPTNSGIMPKEMRSSGSTFERR